MATLPPSLLQAISECLKKAELSVLANASTDLSNRYRNRTASKFMISEAHRLVYLATRLPATYAVNYAVLKNLISLNIPFQSLLDLGAGPGTVMWAAAGLWPTLNKISLIEADPGLIQLGTYLSQTSEFSSLQVASWHQADLSTLQTLIPHDIVSLSYVLSELDQLLQTHLLKLAWQATQRALIIIEPGTPTGFNHIRKVRTWLIQNGATIYAPCPHNLGCPIQRQDWCHFSVRLPRSKVHRQLKSATLGYEDEKYSYLIACKAPGHQGDTRIIRKPVTAKNQVILDLCTPLETQKINIGRKDKAIYLKARKVKWGEVWGDFSSS
ncbi:MAG: rRNA methyltransferase [Alphaproteobacteria bacterium]|nr:rRNA methyltransferase [Alphaproteobacteria bacterium]